MRKVYVVRLQQEERAPLHALIRKGTAAAYTLTHARVLLKADQGASKRRVTDQAVASAVDVGPATVARIRQRFVDGGGGSSRAAQAPGPAVSRASAGWES